MAKDDKTNVMRLLSGAGISFTEHSYEPSVTDGERVAQLIGTELNATFKTLVTKGDSGKYFVFVIPVCKELDLKSAAKAAGEKSVAMIPQKELFPLTGYIHGGCSPVGMKKRLPVFFDESSKDLAEITLSAGKVGRQVSVDPEKLIEYCSGKTAKLTREKHF